MTAEGSEGLFLDAVAAFDADARVEAGTGFGGSPGRRVNDRIFAMLTNGSLVVKLPAARVTELTGTGMADPSDAGKGRPMREWAAVPVAQADLWARLVAEAFDFVAGQGKPSG